MKSREEILKDYKVCKFSNDCKGCSYFSEEDSFCLDDNNCIERGIVELLESDVDYKSGMEEAWELAKKLRSMNYDDLIECFDLGYLNDIFELTPYEVKSKIEDWQNKKINIGDIVEEDGVYGLVIDIDCNTLYVLNENRVVDTCMSNNVIKTNRHINLDDLFKQIEQIKK